MAVYGQTRYEQSLVNRVFSSIYTEVTSAKTL